MINQRVTVQKKHYSRNKLGLLSIYFYQALLITFSTVLPAYAMSEQSHESIQQAAQDYVQSVTVQPEQGLLTVTANNLEPRLTFEHCPEPLVASTPGKQVLTTNATVLIRCASKHWQTYVSVRIQLMIPFVIATRALGRNTTLSASDLSITMIESRLQKGTIYNDISQVIGAKTKYAIATNQAIVANDICMVCRNDSVILKAGNNNMVIVTKGIALNDGVYGDEVRVRNIKSNRIVAGVVSQVGEVTVSF